MADGLSEEASNIHPDLFDTRKVIPSVAVPMAIYDTSVKPILVNEAMHRLFRIEGFGDNIAATLGKRQLRHLSNTLISPDDLPFNRTLAGEVVTSEQFRMTKAEGDERERIIEIDTAPIPMGGKIVGGVFLARDVTEREGTRVKAIDRAAELDAIFLSTAESVIIYNNDGHILRMNGTARQVFGYTDDLWTLSMEERLTREPRIVTLEGKPFPPAEFPPLRALRGEKAVSMPMAVVHPDGKTTWLLGSASPIGKPNAGDERQGVVATFADFSRLREIELQRETYIHSITHDLRTPLAAIRGFAEMLKEELEETLANKDMQFFCDHILSNAEQISRLLADLVEVARFESRLYRTNPERVDLLPYAITFLHMVQAVFDTKRVQLEIPMDLPIVCVDPNALGRILSNLVGNALKFSPADREVIVQAKAVDGFVEVAIRDFGPGMSDEVMLHLFERYRSAQATRQDEGLGLGLYIAHMLVEAHGGRIWAVREEHGGSSLRFTIPTEGCG